MTTIESPEPILVEADDPIESVDLLDDTTVVSDDYTEKKEIVIKMEDVTSNEEDVIAEEWNNDESWFFVFKIFLGFLDTEAEYGVNKWRGINRILQKESEVFFLF